MTKLAIIFLCTASALPSYFFGAPPDSLKNTECNFATGGSPTWIATGDFNGDGVLDLFTPNGYGSSVSVLLGKGDGTFGAPVNTTVLGQSEYAAVGDFNKDGKLDAIVTNIPGDIHLPPSMTVLLGKGDATFRQGFTFSFESSDALGVPTVGDLNHDGNIDIVIPSTSIGRVIVLLGKGDGTFRLPVFYLAGNNPGMAQIADFNGDGIPDIVTVNTNSVAVLLGKGDGTFSPAIYSTGRPQAQGIAVGDLNGNGKLDVVLGGEEVAVLLGEGDGTFETPVLYLAGGIPASIAIGDLNADGKLDVVAAESNALAVLLGNGDGTFLPDMHYFPFGQSPTGLVLADFNGDGIPDVASADPTTSSVSVVLGNGNGTFKIPPACPASPGAAVAHAGFVQRNAE